MSDEALTHTMIVGTSEPQDFQLTDDELPLDGTDWDVEIVWRGTPPLGSPTVAWLSQEDGTVRVTNVANMTVGDYRFRWKLTDNGDGVAFIPNQDTEPNVWRVARV